MAVSVVKKRGSQHERIDPRAVATRRTDQRRRAASWLPGRPHRRPYPRRRERAAPTREANQFLRTPPTRQGREPAGLPAALEGRLLILAPIGKDAHLTAAQARRSGSGVPRLRGSCRSCTRGRQRGCRRAGRGRSAAGGTEPLAAELCLASRPGRTCRSCVSPGPAPIPVPSPWPCAPSATSSCSSGRSVSPPCSAPRAPPCAPVHGNTSHAPSSFPSKRPTAARTSSLPRWRMSCATRWRRSAIRWNCCGSLATACRWRRTWPT